MLEHFTRMDLGKERIISSSHLVLPYMTSFWRTVAIGTPSLWSSIHIDSEDLNSRTDLNGGIQILRSVLDNSKVHPLDVKIIMTSEQLGILTRWQKLYDMLHAHCHRWRSLALYLPPDVERSRARMVQLQFLSISCRSTLRGFEILESVELSHIYSSSDHSLLLALQRAPALKKAILLSFDKSFQAPSLTLPWRQLRYLDISTADGSPFPEQQVMSALSQCTSLQTLVLRHDRICSSENHSISSHPPPPFQLDALHTLEIRFSPPAWVTSRTEWITSRFTLPNLRTLLLRDVRWNMDNDLSSLEAMLQRSSCTIQTLEVSGISVGDVSVLRLLRHPSVVYHLERLILKGHPTGHLFESIAGDYDLLLQLEELHVSMAHDNQRGVVLSPPIRGLLSLASSKVLKTFVSEDSSVIPLYRRIILVYETKFWLYVNWEGYLQTLWLSLKTGDIPIYLSLFNDLERLLQEINLTDAELMWVGEVQYVLLTVGSGNTNVSRDSESQAMVARANELLKRLSRVPPVSVQGTNQVVRSTEKKEKGPFRVSKKIWRAVGKAFHGH
ncbi:hypothetical protein L218DRAFT_1028231 [Marasmius fiardii PR-910]|nr:hypothetical protein L218DRAFT_1028231 [Marasmius fiardii PR-910]